MLRRLAAILALSIIVAAGTLGAAGTAHATNAEIHFELVKSDPESDAIIGEAPEAVRLWFSQEPQTAGARVRIMGPDEALVTTSDVHQNDADKNLVSADILSELQPGTHTVMWRAMGPDGHIISGEFTFSYDTTTETQ